MSHHAHPSENSHPVLSRTTLFVMAAATGVCVANLYYNQPLLGQIQATFGVGIREIGWIPTLTQAGYALGMFFLVPMGDMLERKKLILGFTLLSAFLLAWVALSPNFLSIAVASLALGLGTTTPQLIIPFAAHLAPANQRGRVVGTMMSGLLLGILLARTISGFIGAAFGWRVMFGLAAVVVLLVTVLLAIFIPKSEPTFHGKYSGLIQSVGEIFRSEPVLRESSFFGAMLFGAFSAFWANLIHLMETPAFNLGARAVGLFGLLGAAAALATPWVGALTDRRDARTGSGIMIIATILSFLIFLVSAQSLIGLAIGVIVMDIGVQSGHICNQSRIFSLLPEARSRIQTAYMFCYFLGGALGSLLGTWSWGTFQWSGVCLSAIFLLLLALGRFIVKPRPSQKGAQVPLSST
jgi:predicted MFS family arabinose efflux permease